MSRTSLKKELSTLDRDQIIDLVVTAYGSNRSIKEYFDFFCNPDVDKLYEKHLGKIAKELTRGRFRKSTARISRIKRTIRDFESFNPGADAIRDLRLATVRLMIGTYASREFTKTLTEGTLAILNDTISFADKHFMVDSTLNAIVAILDDGPESNKRLRTHLAESLLLIPSQTVSRGSRHTAS